MRLTREMIEKHVSLAELEAMANSKKNPPYYSKQYAEEFILWVNNWKLAGLAPAFIHNPNMTPETLRQRVSNGKRFAIDNDMIPPGLQTVIDNMQVNRRGDGIIITHVVGSVLLASTTWTDAPAAPEPEKPVMSTYAQFLQLISEGQDVIDIKNIILEDEEITKFERLASITDNYQIIVSRERIKAVRVS